MLKPLNLLFNAKKHNIEEKKVDISNYDQLQAILKKKSKSYKPKRLNILTKDHFAKFLQHADDREWLLTKVGKHFHIKSKFFFQLVLTVGWCLSEERAHSFGYLCQE